MATADLSQPLNLAGYTWIIIPHEVMLTLCPCLYLNAVKQQIKPVQLLHDRCRRGLCSSCVCVVCGCVVDGVL